MKRLFLFLMVIGLVTLTTTVEVQGVELEAGASFNTVAMDYLNEIIDIYNTRGGAHLPDLDSGISFFGDLMLGFPLLDLGLGVESISASAHGIDPHGNPARVSTSALGFLGIGRFIILRGGLRTLISAAFGRYSATYFSDLEGLEAQGSGIGYKIEIVTKLKLGNLLLSSVLGFRNLAFDKLIGPRGNILTVQGKPYLDFSGFELGLGVGLRF